MSNKTPMNSDFFGGYLGVLQILLERKFRVLEINLHTPV